MKRDIARRSRESLSAQLLDVRNQMVSGPSEDMPDLLTTNIYAPIARAAAAQRERRSSTERASRAADVLRVQINERNETRIREEPARRPETKEDMRRGYEAFIARLQAEMLETKKAHEKLLEVTASKMNLQRELNALSAELATYRSAKGAEAIKRLQDVIERLSREKRSLQQDLDSHQHRIDRLTTKLTRITRDSAVVSSDAKSNLDKLGAVYNKLLDSYNEMRARSAAVAPQLSAELHNKSSEVQELLVRNRQLAAQLAEKSLRGTCRGCAVKEATISKLVQKKLSAQTLSETKVDVTVEGRPTASFSTARTTPTRRVNYSPASQCTPPRGCHCDCVCTPHAALPSFVSRAFEQPFTAPISPVRTLTSYSAARPLPPQPQPQPATPGGQTITINTSTSRRVLHSHDKRYSVSGQSTPRQVLPASYSRPAGSSFKYSVSTAGTASPGPTPSPLGGGSFTALAAAAQQQPVRQISLLNSTDYREVVNRRRLIGEVFGCDTN